MPTFSKRLRELRTSKDLSQQKLAELLNTSKSSINMYERGEREPGLEMLESIADYFNVDLDYLLGKTDVPLKISFVEVSAKNKINQSKGLKIPVLGSVRAGLPMEAVENIIDYEEISEEMARQGDFFALQIKGDSMEPRIKEGDVVIVRKQPDVESGEIAIVLVNGDEATIKKVQKFTGGVNLVPSNPSYEVKTFTNQQIESLPVKILGKVVELRAKF